MFRIINVSYHTGTEIQVENVMEQIIESQNVLDYNASLSPPSFNRPAMSRVVNH